MTAATGNPIGDTSAAGTGKSRAAGSGTAGSGTAGSGTAGGRTSGRSVVSRWDVGGIRAIGAAAVAVVGAAVAIPVAAVLLRAVRVDESWSVDALTRVLGSNRTWRVMGLTVAQAAGSTAVTLAVGLPVAWVLSRYSFRGRRFLRTLSLVPFVLPTVVIGAAFASLLGPAGIADLRGTWWAVLAAHLCFNMAVVISVVGAALSELDPDLESAARMLGANPLAAARRVLLPAVAPAVGAAAAVVFLFCLTSFGVIVILGGGAVTTVEVEIWVRSTQQFDLSGAAVLSALQVLAVVLTLALHARITRRRAGGPGPPKGTRTGRRVRSSADRIAVTAAVVTVLVVVALPLAALLERSLRVGEGYGIDHWSGLGSATEGTGLAVSPLDAVVTSTISAALAAAVSVLVAVPAAVVAARRPGGMADRVLLVPLGVSATTIGLGVLLAAGRPPLDLRGSWWLVPAAQALVAVPLVVRAVVPAVRDLSPAVRDAAALLGADRRSRWWRVELPLLRPAITAGAGLALVACLGEFGATVFLARTDRPTVPVAVERLLSRPGAAGLGQAMALSCTLVLLCGILLLAVDLLGRGAAHTQERRSERSIRLGF